MQVKKQQIEPDMEQQTGSKLGKEYDKAVYIITLLSQFGTSLLFHVRFYLLLLDLHTGFSGGRSDGLVFPVSFRIFHSFL